MANIEIELSLQSIILHSSPIHIWICFSICQTKLYLYICFIKLNSLTNSLYIVLTDREIQIYINLTQKDKNSECKLKTATNHHLRCN